MTPQSAMLRGYQRSWLRGDLIAGVTVAAYLVPQVMAYATVAGLHPVAGLWAALPALVVYALLGSSPSLSTGPEATTALMTAIAIGPLAAGNPARYAELAATLALLVGLMGAAAWLLRLGVVSDLLSRPVLVGYMAGVAVIMIAGQLGRVTGVTVTGQEFAGQLGSFTRNIGQTQPGILAVAAAVLAFLLLLRWRWPAAPGPLIAVLLATLAVAAFSLSRHGVAVIGAIPAGFPVPRLPALQPHVLRTLLLPAFTVLIVAFSDDVLTGRSFARRGETIVANRELLALGAIVIYAALRLIDITAFQRLLKFRRAELLIALSACAGVLAFNILYGVLVAIGLSVADLLVRVARPHDAIQGLVPGLAGMHDVDDYPEARTIPGLVVYRYDAPLCFANADDFRRRALAAARQQPGPLRWFGLNVEANVEVDFTALEALDTIREEITGQGAVFALARVKQDLLARLQAFGLYGKIETDRLYPTLPTAVDAYRRWVGDHPCDAGPSSPT